MRIWFRFRNDPRRFKPLVTGSRGTNAWTWTVTTTTISEEQKLLCFYDWVFAIEQANCWADEYRAAWVAANMKAA